MYSMFCDCLHICACTFGFTSKRPHTIQQESEEKMGEEGIEQESILSTPHPFVLDSHLVAIYRSIFGTYRVTYGTPIIITIDSSKNKSKNRLNFINPIYFSHIWTTTLITF